MKNKNLTTARKELILWHWKLGHIIFQWIHQLLRLRTKIDSPIDTISPSKLTSFLPFKLSTSSTYPTPFCSACQLSRVSGRHPIQKSNSKNSSTTMPLRSGNILPVEIISLDLYESSVRVRIPHTFGK